MSIIKRDFLSKALIAVAAAAAIGGATVSTGYAEAVSGFETDLVESITSVTYPAVAANPGGPRATANSFLSGAAKTPAAAKDPSGAENSDRTDFTWESIFVDN